MYYMIEDFRERIIYSRATPQVLLTSEQRIRESETAVVTELDACNSMNHYHTQRGKHMQPESRDRNLALDSFRTDAPIPRIHSPLHDSLPLTPHPSETTTAHHLAVFGHLPKIFYNQTQFFR